MIMRMYMLHPTHLWFTQTVAIKTILKKIIIMWGYKFFCSSDIGFFSVLIYLFIFVYFSFHCGRSEKIAYVCQCLGFTATFIGRYFVVFSYLC